MYEVQRLIDIRIAENQRGKILVAIPDYLEGCFLSAISGLKKWKAVSPPRMGDGALLAGKGGMHFVRFRAMDHRARLEECLARGCFDAGFLDEDWADVLYVVRTWNFPSVKSGNLHLVARVNLGEEHKESLRKFGFLMVHLARFSMMTLSFFHDEMRRCSLGGYSPLDG